PRRRPETETELVLAAYVGGCLHTAFSRPLSSAKVRSVLLRLHVKNLAVLAGAEVEFGPGLNVLTGETGAGKSIVVDSLALLAGARAASDLIREGADTLTV